MNHGTRTFPGPQPSSKRWWQQMISASRAPAEETLHLGIIMDGNGRWAEAHGLPRQKGHRAGYRNVVRLVDAAADMGVTHLTLFGFSTENWGRDPREVRSLMSVFEQFLTADAPRLAARGVWTRAVGRIGDLPASIQAALDAATELRPRPRRLTLILALAYGGRAEIADAVRRAHEAGDRLALSGDESALAAYLYAPDVPPPDLIVRTGGRRRLSNFLLWQAAYSELWFTDTLWPDFSPAELETALRDFTDAQRTFGRVPVAPRRRAAR
jgi:undecaprenyl diphosphate synthase